MPDTVDDTPATAGTLRFRADQGDAGGRLDRAVLRHGHAVSGLSRTRVQQWIEDGHVTVDGRAARRSGVTVPAGAHIEVRLPDTARLRARPEAEAGALDVVFEDPHLLVVNKPAGLVAHPSFRNTNGTLLNRVLWHVRGRTDPATPGLVSRLDKGTSGLVAVALTPGAHANLQRAAARGLVEKQYLALVAGRPRPATGRIALPLRRDAGDRRRMVVADDGDPSETRYETVATSTTAALVHCTLVTGRSHQIRVHLAASGWPILGDPAYGVGLEGLDRPALHAARLALPHPVTGERLDLDAPLPRDLVRAAAAVGLEHGA